MSGFRGPFVEEDTDSVARLIQLNCGSVVGLTAWLLPPVLAAGHGLAPGRPRGVAVTATPGELHALPALMTVARPREDRWQAHHLAAGTPNWWGGSGSSLLFVFPEEFVSTARYGLPLGVPMAIGLGVAGSPPHHLARWTTDVCAYLTSAQD